VSKGGFARLLGGGESPLLKTKRVITAAEIASFPLSTARNRPGNSVEILPSPGAGKAYLVHYVTTHKFAGTTANFSTRYNPEITLAYAPASTVGSGLNANTGDANIYSPSNPILGYGVNSVLANVRSSWVYNQFISTDIYPDAVIVAGMVGTVLSADNTKLNAQDGTLQFELFYEIIDVDI